MGGGRDDAHTQPLQRQFQEAASRTLCCGSRRSWLGGGGAARARARTRAHVVSHVIWRHRGVSSRLHWHRKSERLNCAVVLKDLRRLRGWFQWQGSKRVNKHTYRNARTTFTHFWNINQTFFYFNTYSLTAWIAWMLECFGITNKIYYLLFIKNQWNVVRISTLYNKIRTNQTITLWRLIS